MKIHAIQTGSVRIKSSQRVGRGQGQLRQLHVLFDRTWTEWLPIYAWAIESSEGTLLVDTGETARTALPGYFPRWHPYFWLAVQLSVTARAGNRPAAAWVGDRSTRRAESRADPPPYRSRRWVGAFSAG